MKWFPDHRRDRLFWGFMLVYVAALAAGAFDGWPEAIALRADRARAEEFARFGVWWGGLLAAPALVAAHYLARGLGRNARGPRAAIPQSWLIALVAIVVAAAIIRWPRLEASLYADEEYTLRRYVHGQYRAREGEPVFRPVPWVDTFFRNEEGNNHVLASVAGRALHEAWKPVAGLREGEFDLRAIRFPAFLGGLLSIAAAAFLAARLGFSAAGLGAAFLLAVHPWHVRYSAECRGYGLAFFFAMAGLYFLARALAENRRGLWWAYAGCSAALFLSYAGSIYLLAAQNLFALLWILGRREERWHTLRLFVAGNLIAGAIAALLYAPSVPQLMGYLALDRARGAVDLGWLQNFGSLLSLGFAWRGDDPRNFAAITADTLSPWARVVAPILLATLGAAGAIRLIKRGGAGRIIACALLAVLPLALLHNRLASNLLYLWYLVYLVPGWAILTAAGAGAFGHVLRSPAARASAAAAALLAYLLLVASPLAIIRHRGKEPLKEAVAFIYGETDSRSPEAANLLVTGFWTNAHPYAPRMGLLRSVGELERLERSAAESDRPLYVTYGHEKRAQGTVPDLVGRVRDPRRYRHLLTLPGLDERQFTHEIFRFHPTP